MTYITREINAVADAALRLAAARSKYVRLQKDSAEANALTMEAAVNNANAQSEYDSACATLVRAAAGG